MRLDPRNSLTAWLSVYSCKHRYTEVRAILKNLSDDDVNLMLDAINNYRGAILSAASIAYHIHRK